METLMSNELAVEVSGTAVPTLVVPIGPGTARIIEDFNQWKPSMDAAHRFSTAVVGGQNLAGSIRSAADGLLSAANIDHLERLGYEIPGKKLGLPLRFHVVCVIDVGHADSASECARIMTEVRDLKVDPILVAIVIGAETLPDLLQHSVVTNGNWDVVFPFPTHEPSAGVRSVEDISLTVSRLLLLLAVRDRAGLWNSLSARRTSSALHHVVRVGLAVLDVNRGELADLMIAPAVAAMLEGQYGNSRPFEPPETFDSDKRTNLLERVNADRLAGALLAATPFRLVTERESLRLRIADSIVTVRTEGLPRRRWVASLLKLRDVLQFAKAQQWAQSMDSNQKELSRDLEAVVSEDAHQLHNYFRGPDRFLRWCMKATEKLKEPLSMARPPGSSFAEAIEKLKAEIANAPNTISMWACVFLLGWLGAEAVRHLTQIVAGPTWSWIAFGFSGVVAAVAGVAIQERVHRRVNAALRNAQSALVQVYEAQAAENLLLLLNRLRPNLIAKIDEERAKLESQTAAALTVADAMKGRSVSESSGVVNVEKLIPAGLSARFLENLTPDWGALCAEAAKEGRFRPSPDDGPCCMQVTAESLSDFAGNYLRGRVEDLEIGRLIDFRMQADPGFGERIVRDLNRRAAALAPRSPRWTVWEGSEEILARFREQISNSGDDAAEEAVPLGLLACIKIETDSVSLAGGRR